MLDKEVYNIDTSLSVCHTQNIFQRWNDFLKIYLT